MPRPDPSVPLPVLATLVGLLGLPFTLPPILHAQPPDSLVTEDVRYPSGDLTLAALYIRPAGHERLPGAGHANHRIEVVPGAGHGFLDMEIHGLMPAFTGLLTAWLQERATKR